MIDLSQGELALLLVRSLTSGMLLGLTYDAVRAFKMLLGVDYGDSAKKERKRSVEAFLFAVTFVSDLIFFTSAGCVAIFLAYADGGFFRGLILLGMVSGFLLYYFTLGRLVLALDRRLISLFKKLLYRLLSFMIKPLKRALDGIIFLYHLTIGAIIDKIINDRKNKGLEDKRESEQDLDTDVSERGKEDFVYVDGKAGYRREGRVSFGSRGR